jgi:two-component system, response regulator PdtaR
MSRGIRIAIAEDEPDVREYFRRILPQLGHAVVGAAANGEELVQLCREQLPDLVITDLRMPNMDGDQAMQVVWSERETPCIFISAYSKPVPHGNGANRSDCVCLTKPVSRDELEKAIQQVTAPSFPADVG